MQPSPVWRSWLSAFGAGAAAEVLLTHLPQPCAGVFLSGVGELWGRLPISLECKLWGRLPISLVGELWGRLPISLECKLWGRLPISLV